VTDFFKELLPRIVAEAKDGTGLVFAVTNGDTADRKAGHFNAVPVGGAGAGLPPRQTAQFRLPRIPAYGG
jgi:hypothetical protein